MKRTVNVIIVAWLGAGLVGSAAVNRAQRPDDVNDEAAIRKVIGDQIAAFNRHEVDRSLFTDDADFVNARGIWLRGVDEIERGRRTQYQTALKGARLKLLDLRVRFIRADVALAHATYEIAGMLGRDGVIMPPHEELGLTVLTKNNERWRVTAFHIATVTAPQAPARP